jgi:hypothetical protein
MINLLLIIENQMLFSLITNLKNGINILSYQFRTKFLNI